MHLAVNLTYLWRLQLFLLVFAFINIVNALYLLSSLLSRSLSVFMYHHHHQQSYCGGRIQQSCTCCSHWDCDNARNYKFLIAQTNFILHFRLTFTQEIASCSILSPSIGTTPEWLFFLRKFDFCFFLYIRAFILSLKIVEPFSIFIEINLFIHIYLFQQKLYSFVLKEYYIPQVLFRKIGKVYKTVLRIRNKGKIRYCKFPLEKL